MRLLAAAAFIVCLSVGGSVPLSAAVGPTTVQGPLSGDVAWTVDRSPYLLSGAVTVRRGARLTVEPGVEVRAQPDAALIVRGVLRVEGSVTEPVVFRAASPPRRWGGIHFAGTGGMRREDSRSVISYARIRNARSAVTATYDSPAIRDVAFTKNRRGVALMMPAAAVQLQRVQFFSNDVALSGRTAATVSVTGSDFYDNRRTLVAGPKRPYDCVRDDGVWAVQGNDILRGPDDGWRSNDVATAVGSYHSYYSGFRVDLRYNYWNALDNDDVEGRILDAVDWKQSWKDGLRTKILWDPLLPAPLTPWTPPGPVAQPSNVTHDHPDPATYTYVTSPVDTACVTADKATTIRGYGVNQFAKIRWVDVAVKRLGDDGCTWLTDRRATLRRRSCARPVWLRAEGQPDGPFIYRYRLPLSRSLPPGRYVAYSRSKAEPGLELARNKIRFRIR